MNRVRVTYIPGLPVSPKITPGLISSASRRTNPGGTGCVYWPDADTERTTAPTAQTAHLIPFETLITSPYWCRSLHIIGVGACTSASPGSAPGDEARAEAPRAVPYGVPLPPSPSTRSQVMVPWIV